MIKCMLYHDRVPWIDLFILVSADVPVPLVTVDGSTYCWLLVATRDISGDTCLFIFPVGGLRCYTCNGAMDNSVCNRPEDLIDCATVANPGMEFDTCQTRVSYAGKQWTKLTIPTLHMSQISTIHHSKQRCPHEYVVGCRAGVLWYMEDWSIGTGCPSGH